MSESDFPGEGILWRGWNEETLALIQQKGLPVLLFVADPNALAWPFLKAVFRAMPASASGTRKAAQPSRSNRIDRHHTRTAP